MPKFEVKVYALKTIPSAGKIRKHKLNIHSKIRKKVAEMVNL